MLKFNFDHQKVYRAVIYARMSTDQQNPRSPEQQIDTINELLQKMGLPWTIVKIYRDDGISGRYARKRPDYRRMLRDLKSGQVNAQLILVDTFERLSRARDAAIERQKLENAGVLVLTADTRFADPTTGAGQAMASFEALRAQQDGQVKAHNVLRGKRDAVRRKQWPGGPVPMGFRLRNVMTINKGIEEISHRVLEPDPDRRFVIEEAFRLADQYGWSGIRITKQLNADIRVPEELKPLISSTVSYWLDSQIYAGRYEWGKHCTGIVNDVRVLQANPEEDWERIDDFCEPLLDPDVFDRVQSTRQKRKRPAAKTAAPIDSLYPRAVGVALKYPLSGLVRCSHCGRAMVANGSAPYVAKSGESRRYTAYICPGYLGVVCCNSRRVPETWLRGTVFALVRNRLLFSETESNGPSDVPESTLAADRPTACEVSVEQLMASPRFQEFLQLVDRELRNLVPDADDRIGLLCAEKDRLVQQHAGWVQSLGNPELPASIRRTIETEFATSTERVQAIVSELREVRARESSRHEAVDPRLVAERLARLSEVLGGENASATNVILSQHIESIRCDSEGRVVVRSCKLGCVAEDLELIQPAETERRDTTESGVMPTVGRRRTRRNVGDAFEDDDAATDANDFAVDLERFAGLGPEWFCDDVFFVPQRQSWSEEHASEVAEYRLGNRASVQATAEHFGKTTPTIWKALRFARDVHGIDAFGRSVCESSPSWPEQNYAAVAEFFECPEATMKTAVAHFGKSAPTIKKARELAVSRAEDRNRSSE